MDASTTLGNLKTFTIGFDIDLRNMHRSSKKTFSRAILQWLLEASAKVLIITYMMISSSSAYGSSFHDNGDGNDNKKICSPPASARAPTTTTTTTTVTITAHPRTTKEHDPQGPM